MNNDPNTKQNLGKLIDMIKDIKVAMLTTMDDDNCLRSRPMRAMEVKPDGDIWFFTGYHSGKSHEIQHDAHVNLSYSDPDNENYVSISGRAQVLRDQKKIDELWNPAMKTWFPKGKEDPNVGLLKITIDKAEYWDAPNSVMVHLYGMVKAALTGERPDAGENKKINL